MNEVHILQWESSYVIMHIPITSITSIFSPIRENTEFKSEGTAIIGICSNDKKETTLPVLIFQLLVAPPLLRAATIYNVTERIP